MKQCGSEYLTWPLFLSTALSGIKWIFVLPNWAWRFGYIRNAETCAKDHSHGLHWRGFWRGSGQVIVCLHTAQALCRGLAESDLSLGNLGPSAAGLQGVWDHLRAKKQTITKIKKKLREKKIPKSYQNCWHKRINAKNSLCWLQNYQLIWQLV